MDSQRLLASIPTVFERQYNATGITYEDPTLNGLMVGSTAFRDWDVSSGNKNYANPVVATAASIGGWNYDFLIPVNPERFIRSDIDKTLNSRVGMFSSHLNTSHPGVSYLDRIK